MTLNELIQENKDANKFFREAQQQGLDGKKAVNYVIRNMINDIKNKLPEKK